MIKFIEEKRPWTESVSIVLLFEGGLLYENKENNGISALFSTAYKKSSTFINECEFQGASLSVSVFSCYLRISLSSPKDIINGLIDGFISFLTEPTIKEDIFLREQALQIKKIASSEDMPNYLAKKSFYNLCYEGTCFALASIGEKQSVEKLTLDDINAYTKKVLKKAGTIVSVAGNYDESLIERLKEGLKPLDEGIFQGYNGKKGFSFSADKRLEEEDQIMQQTKLLIGYNAPIPADASFPYAKLLDEILGGGMSSRYFTEIRKNSGYAYQVSSNISSLVYVSSFTISMGIDYKNLESAINKIDAIHTNLSKTLTEEDIQKAKNCISASILSQFQANFDVANIRSFALYYGCPPTFYQKEYLNAILAATKEDILKASELLFQPRVIYARKPKEEKKNISAKYSLKNKKDQIIFTSKDK